MDIYNIIFIVLIVIVLLFFMFTSGEVDTSFLSKKPQSEKSAMAALFKVLKRFSTMKNFDVLGKTTLSFGGESYTFDAVLLGFFGTIAIKADCTQGDIYGQMRDEQWTVVNNEKKSYIENPLNQLGGSVRFFKDLYKAEKVKGGQADAILVFPSKKARLYGGKNVPAATLDNLYNTLSSSKYLKDNGADVEAMKAALAKYTVK